MDTSDYELARLLLDAAKDLIALGGFWLAWRKSRAKDKDQDKEKSK